MPLSKRQKDFADYYIELGNATEAAKRAGYKPEYAGTNATKLLKNTNVSEYINNRMAQIDAERIADQNEVLKFFTSVMRGEKKDQFGLDASLETRLKAGENLMKRYMAGGINYGKQKTEDDPLTRALKEEAERLQNGDQ